jgi:hypothetical protein
MSYSRDSGAPAYGDANTNVRVDFVYGNMPLQPNEDRSGEGVYKLGAGGNHSIALTEWNEFPTNSANGYTGRTLEGGDAFYWPAVGLCNTWGIEENRFQTVAKELIACGVPAEWLTDAQWTGGDHSYDDENGTYDTNSGRVFYYYIEPGSDMGYDATGVKYYGADFDGTVMYGSENPNVEGDVAAKNDFYLVVFQSHTPGLETADWL